MIQTLVTGGTGFVGSAIVKQLVEQKETVLVLTRNPIKVEPSRRVPGAHYIEGDVMDPLSLQKAVKGCDSIVHCVQFPGAPFENPKKGWTYVNVDGQGTKNLCNAAKEENIQRMIYISGLGAGQNRTESWFVAKDMAEKAIVENIPHPTILRPSIMYGPQDQSLNKLLLATKMPVFFPMMGRGQSTVAPLFIEDLAKVVGYCLNRTSSFGQIFELGGPEKMTFLSMIQKALQVVGKKRIFVPIPVGIFKSIAKIIKHLPIAPILTEDGIDFILMDVPIEPLKAHAFFPFTFTPLNEGLRKYL